MIKYFLNAFLFLLVLNGQSLSQYTLQIISAGNGSGSITVDGNLENLNYSSQFSENSSVNLSAGANIGSHFIEWTGDLVSTNSDESILMDADKIVYVNFELNQYNINLTSNPVEGGNLSGDGIYNFGDEAIVSASPNSGFEFNNWTENSSIISNNTLYNFTVNSDKDLVANFSTINYTINGNTDIGDVTLTWFDGTEQTTTSASNGNYSITVPYNWSGLVTPTKIGYSFDPIFRSYNTVTSNRFFQNYTAILNSYTITGNTGVGEVTLSWFDVTSKTMTSNTDGSYTITIPYNWSGTVTPSKAGYTFVPTNRTYSNVTANQVNQNYVGTLNSYTITGNTGVGEVTLSWFDVTSKTMTSNTDGSYTITIPYNWSGTVTPSKAGYTFVPTNRTYSNVISNQVNQNYVGTLNSYTITGNTGVGEVTLSWFDVTSKTMTSNTDGSYTITIPYNWSGTVTPSKAGYTFVPTNRTYSNVISNQVNQNYVGTLNSYTITGNTGVGEVTLSWFDVTSKTMTSNTDGSYTITIPYNWSGTVTPSKAGYTFVPTNRTYSNVISNQVNQNYVGTLNSYTITGNTGVGEVTLSWFDVTSKTMTSNTDGSYTITIPYNWSGTVTPSKAGYTFVPTNRTYSNVTANQVNQNFNEIIDNFEIKFSLGGTGNGKIKVNGVSQTLPYNETFNYNSQITIEASAAIGSNFTSWSGDLSGNTNPTNIFVTSVKNINVNFTLKTYSISLSKAPIQGGTVIGQGTYNYGTELSVIATPNKGWNFTNWTQNNIPVSFDSLYKFTVDTNRTLTANFSRRIHSVTTIVNPTLSGTISGGGNYDEGDNARLVPTPSTGWRFVNWTENGNILSTDSIYTFSVEFDRIITGNFTKKIYSVTTSIIPEESGTLNGAGNYQHGATVTISTIANEGWLFKNWTENDQLISENSTYIFVIDKPRNFIANYEKKKYDIVLSASPEIGGNIDGDSTYSHGDTVTIVASANTNSGYDFVNWTESGTQVSTNSTYTFIANKNRTLVANFRLRTYSISLTVFPVNSGSVTGTNTYTHGQTVTVQANPASGWLFVNWTENNVNVSNNSSYSFVANNNRSLIANFSKDVYSISAFPSPIEGGSISGTGSFYYGQIATLIAAANPGWAFVNWTKNGTIVSTDSNYIFTVNSSENLLANFKLADYLINCSSEPSEAGFTSGCGIARYNQTMMISAEPNNGYEFVNWTENGVVVSFEIEYEFVVKKSRNIVAQFDLINSIEMDESMNIPENYYLSNAYPNPFNPETNLKFGLPEQSTVNLIIVDITGRIVQTVIDDIFLPAGNYVNHINGSNFASGIYFYIITVSSNISDKQFRKTGKFILLK
ncbi:MAG: T9SS type A sorting domain-containing protein [Ignavibacteriae bacterium]|nr:T9SS type A sorting domain-containing protein [Ignavibacteriota bacterium]